jgi:hypothetical protein
MYSQPRQGRCIDGGRIAAGAAICHGTVTVTRDAEEMLRSFLEKATRKSSFRRTLPADVGGASIYVSGSAGLKYLFRQMESVDPALCRSAQEFVARGHVVWDIGANIGLFSFASAHLAGPDGKVFAFEPDSWLVQLLRRRFALERE